MGQVEWANTAREVPRVSGAMDRSKGASSFMPDASRTCELRDVFEKARRSHCSHVIPLHPVGSHGVRDLGRQIRKAYGRFWYRFMNGESGADVYDRATAFWESVHRSMDSTGSEPRYRNYVIITHGLMMVRHVAPASSDHEGRRWLLTRVTLLSFGYKVRDHLTGASGTQPMLTKALA